MLYLPLLYYLCSNPKTFFFSGTVEEFLLPGSKEEDQDITRDSEAQSGKGSFKSLAMEGGRKNFKQLLHLAKTVKILIYF